MIQTTVLTIQLAWLALAPTLPLGALPEPTCGTDVADALIAWPPRAGTSDLVDEYGNDGDEQDDDDRRGLAEVGSVHKVVMNFEPMTLAL